MTYQRYQPYIIGDPVEEPKPDNSPEFDPDAFDGLFVAERRGDFAAKQVYDRHPASTLTCAKCGSDKLGIGVGSHFTVAKCWTCKTELVIHNG